MSSDNIHSALISKLDLTIMYVWVTTDNLTPNQPAALTVVRVGVGNYTLLIENQQSPPQPNQAKGGGAPDRADLHLLGLICVVYPWMCWDEWLFMYQSPVQMLVLSTKADKEATVYRLALCWRGICTISHCMADDQEPVDIATALQSAEQFWCSRLVQGKITSDESCKHLFTVWTVQFPLKQYCSHYVWTNEKV